MMILKRLICLFYRRHLLVRRAVDPSMKMTTKTVIICIECGKEFPDEHLLDIS